MPVLVMVMLLRKKLVQRVQKWQVPRNCKYQL